VRGDTDNKNVNGNATMIVGCRASHHHKYAQPAAKQMLNPVNMQSNANTDLNQSLLERCILECHQAIRFVKMATNAELS
jgi:hypothetical protein